MKNMLFFILKNDKLSADTKGKDAWTVKEKIIGREKEIQRLDRVSREEEAQLVIVYGRRRVGKTFLINQYFSGRFDFMLTGIYNQPKEMQLKGFITELNRQTRMKQKPPADWMDAFELLRIYLEGLSEIENRVVFFDEMPWMDTQKSDFLPAFEWLWNSWAASQSHLVFIVCGSATAWMRDHLDGNKGGLFNRQTCRIYLEPFTLHETECYLHQRGIEWTRYTMVECYMIFGGIPFYLRLLDPEISLNANVDQLLFQKRAELWDEFEHLYRTLFSNSDQYIKIVQVLSQKKNGMTRKELIRESRLPGNGDLSKMLSNLRDSGFVRVSKNFANQREDIYQLADYYSLFYFRFIQPYYGKDERFWSNGVDLPARRAWAGLTFEQVCRDHVRQIKQKLGIGAVLSEESTCRFETETIEEGETPGAQIDLLIDRRDQVINLCEIKYATDEYVIDKEDEASLRNKIERLRKATKNRKSIQMTMITTYGVKQNKYSNLVNAQVTMEDLFSL